MCGGSVGDDAANFANVVPRPGVREAKSTKNAADFQLNCRRFATFAAHPALKVQAPIDGLPAAIRRQPAAGIHAFKRTISRPTQSGLHLQRMRSRCLRRMSKLNAWKLKQRPAKQTSIPSSLYRARSLRCRWCGWSTLSTRRVSSHLCPKCAPNGDLAY